VNLRPHRWWLALVAALLTPWMGPHVDGYLPLGKVLFMARTESADAGFWVIASILITVAYGVWLLLFSVALRPIAGRGKLDAPPVRDERS
jgi:hypothetical protein